MTAPTFPNAANHNSFSFVNSSVAYHTPALWPNSVPRTGVAFDLLKVRTLTGVIVLMTYSALTTIVMSPGPCRGGHNSRFGREIRVHTMLPNDAMRP